MDLFDQLALVALLVGVTALKGLRYAEHQQWWTVVLRMSASTHYLLWGCFVIFAVFGCRRMLLSIGFGPFGEYYFVVTLCFAVGLLFLDVQYLLSTRKYVRLRWKAWAGSSRTGIPPALLGYIGDQDDWATMAASVGHLPLHPVEKFNFSTSRHDSSIIADATEILRARAAADQETNSVWVPRNEQKIGVYQPILTDHPASLLWGVQLGFRPRCSRGIIAIPRPLFSPWPKLSTGLDGNAICLAHGILARNKGLQPSELICNLESKNSFGAFEEHSMFWPRPGKTLRSVYRVEFDRNFSLLGRSYVTAATELALLLIDIKAELIEDWLDGCMEHQDIGLNNALSSVASEEDLARPYRGHYAAMLVSLSLHKKGIRLRPEILVFDALCRLEGVDRPSWATSAELQLRRAEEQRISPAVDESIEAVI